LLILGTESGILIRQLLLFSANIHFLERILSKRLNIISISRVQNNITPRVVAELTDATAGLHELVDSLFRSDLVYVGISGHQFLALSDYLNQGLHILFVLLRARREYVGLGDLDPEQFLLVLFEVAQI